MLFLRNELLLNVPWIHQVCYQPKKSFTLDQPLFYSFTIESWKVQPSQPSPTIIGVGSLTSRWIACCWRILLPLLKHFVYCLLHGSSELDKSWFHSATETFFHFMKGSLTACVLCHCLITKEGTSSMIPIDVAEVGTQLWDSKFLDRQGNSMKWMNSDEHGGHVFHY